jgi:hypothetical protein
LSRQRDEIHAGALLSAGCKEFESFTIAQTPEAPNTWVAKLRERFARRPVAVCLEPIFWFLAHWW